MLARQMVSKVSTVLYLVDLIYTISKACLCLPEKLIESDGGKLTQPSVSGSRLFTGRVTLRFRNANRLGVEKK